MPFSLLLLYIHSALSEIHKGRCVLNYQALEGKVVTPILPAMLTQFASCPIILEQLPIIKHISTPAVKLIDSHL